MDKNEVLVVIQARRGSSRLPNKIMLPLLGDTLLARMVERVAMAERVSQFVVATTDNSEDDLVEQICTEKGWPCFRGHPTDLLDRHYQAAKKFKAKHVAKIPSDVPLIDPKVIDRILGVYLDSSEDFDYVSNLHPETYPYGQDVEVMSFEALEEAFLNGKKDFEREHTTPYIWERPEQFSIKNIEWETGLDYSKSHRWTIDYEEDYEFIKRVFEVLYPINPQFGISEVLTLLENQPRIAKLNENRLGSHWVNAHKDELKTLRS